MSVVLYYSIIVPVYRAENFLNYCVDSILNQSFSDFELILVDDGSNDKSGQICDEYAQKDSRVKVVHKENQGVSAARNTGVLSAKGKYVVFVDSDDYLEPDYLLEMKKAKEQYPDIDNIWCSMQTVTDYEKSNKTPYLFNKDEEYSISSCEKIFDIYEKWLAQMPWNKLFERQKILDNNLKMREHLSLGEDAIFNFEYLDCTNQKIMVINKPLYNYIRSNKESLDNRYYPNLFEIYKELFTVLEDKACKWQCDSGQMAKLYNSCFFKYEDVLRNTFSSENKSIKKEKIKYNNNLLKSPEFTTALSKCDYKPNILFRVAYKSKKYRLVALSEKIISLLKRGK